MSTVLPHVLVSLSLKAFRRVLTSGLATKGESFEILVNERIILLELIIFRVS